MDNEGSGSVEGTPFGAVTLRDAKVDPEASRRFAERLTEQGREHMGAGGDRGHRRDRDDDED